jgi:glutaminyl-tRNA synthetase
MSKETTLQKNFIHDIIDDDLKQQKYGDRVHTRFPPEPNGYLHIGHAKAINLNFETAQKYSGKCNLRFDDTNPAKEDQEYVNSIKEDVKWLGFEWNEELSTSNYFDKLYEIAVTLIKAGKAYVCDLNETDTREYRGTVKEAGKASPFRNRTPEENLELFEKMKAGEFEDSACTLRAKIDMSHANMKMRDPLIYRIRRQTHHNTGDTWCIYPMYDFAHPISDALEGITHSLCTLEFENNRAVYDWFVEECGLFPTPPKQYEFARLNLNYTVMSKRKLKELVDQNIVEGWSDPRMPTISGLRRRGYTAASIREFCHRIGLAKRANTVDLGLLEFCLREELGPVSPRRMAVINPLKVTITNYPEDQSEILMGDNHPQNPEDHTQREIPFSKTIYIEKSDFLEDAPKKFFRLSLGREVRLRFAYYVTCTEVIKDKNGEVIELLCTYDPETKGGKSEDGRKVKGTIHWVEASTAVDAKVRLYDRLFKTENPEKNEEGEGISYVENLNCDSLIEMKEAKLEPILGKITTDEIVQFERLGYFCLDSELSQDQDFVFNRSVTLRDSWAKKK